MNQSSLVKFSTSLSETPCFFRGLISYSLSYKHRIESHMNLHQRSMKTAKKRILKDLSDRLRIHVATTILHILQSSVERPENKPHISENPKTFPARKTEHNAVNVVTHTGSFTLGSSDSTAICSLMPCRISKASQSIKHFAFSGSSANTITHILTCRTKGGLGRESSRMH